MDAQKRIFIKSLARHLVENQAGKSIALQLESGRPSPLPQWAKEWAELRSATPIFGYPTVEEAEQALIKFLGQ